MCVDKEIIETLRGIDWFSQCGFQCPSSDEIGLDVRLINDWRIAMEHLSSNEWLNNNLGARNALTSYLSAKHPQAFAEWNVLTKQAKPQIEEIVVPPTLRLQHEKGLSSKLVDSVRWDTLAIVMEASYKSLRPPVFYEKLLKVYQSGHLPCGWVGAWPLGRLLVI